MADLSRGWLTERLFSWSSFYLFSFRLVFMLGVMCLCCGIPEDFAAVSISQTKFPADSDAAVKIHEGPKPKNFKLQGRNPKRKFYKEKSGNDLYYG
ncbi:transmembrane protein, putative [Medicago truncatula]|uniref:Transmembrane protein, putative n=1 Tax=Medicago truncatula TaxID=3880 RepID=G7L8N2_MEDTR|nr:transmembrane protein, putative [Medicago truncatula]